MSDSNIDMGRNNFLGLGSASSFYCRYRIEVLIFLLALFARLALFMIYDQAAGYDMLSAIHGDDGYYEISQGILAGHGFTGMTDFPYSPNPLRPPLWPTIIAALVYFLGSYWAVISFILIMGSIVPLLGMRIAREFNANKKLVTIVGLLLVFEPYGLFLSTNMYSETIFTVLFLSFFVFALRYIGVQSWRNLVWLTVFLNLSILAKATVQYFPLLLPFFILYIGWKNGDRKVWSKILASILISLALMAPWLYRNYDQFGVAGVGAQPAFNLYVYLVPTVLSIDNKTDFATEIQNFVYSKGVNVDSINLTNSKYFTNQALPILFDHKLALFKSGLISLVTFFTHDGMLTVLAHAGVNFKNSLGQPAISLMLSNPVGFIEVLGKYLASPAILILVGRIFWVITTVLFLAGLIGLWKKKKISLAVLVSILTVVYFALTTCINGLGVNARFRTPINVFIFIFALEGFMNMWRGLATRFRPTLEADFSSKSVQK